MSSRIRGSIFWFSLVGTVLLASPLLAETTENLANQVTIRRTEYGVPHILGETEKAAAFGFAWVQCEDHFPLVYQSVVRGRSEMSRWYGASEANIRFDFQTRQLRARKLVTDHYHLLPQDYRDVVAGFAEGINAYMEAHPEEVEPWMSPATPHDLAASWQAAVMRFTFLRGDLIGRFQSWIEKRENRQSSIELETDVGWGSNTISLAPSRTKSGHAMLLNNPHQPWSDQARYYEAHITVPGVYDFYGSTFVGGAILTTGFNRNLGWSHTTNAPDLEEFYEVTLDPDRPDHYLFDGGSIPLEKEAVTIATGEDDTQSREMWWSPLGPVVHRTKNKAYILRSAADNRYLTGLQWYRMGKAKNLEEFQEFLRMQEIPMFNIGYADKEGNILYLWNGTVPKLPHDSHQYEPVPVDSSEDIWTEIHPIEDLMQLLNPEGGYVQNCNSPPYFTSLRAPLDRESYPNYFPDNDLSLRTQHGLRLIDNEKKFSLEDLVEAKYSLRMELADRIKDNLIEILLTADLNAEEQHAVTMLKDWDNTASTESVGSVLFAEWWEQYRKGDNLFEVEWSETDPMTTPHGIGSSERAVTAFRKALKEVKKKW
ncbi:MAG: penicillin acylase family protein, partial [Candidatus Omnitrophica bacterium]|nr:penicillin acylase family protein [Candidatus Omnitrophota bacterium]